MLVYSEGVGNLNKESPLELIGKNQWAIQLIYIYQLCPFRGRKKIRKKKKSSCSQMLFKINVLKNFAIFTGKHLC